MTVVTRNGGSRAFALRWLAVDAVAPLLGASLSLLVAPGANVLAFSSLLFCSFSWASNANGTFAGKPPRLPAPHPTLATLAGIAFLYAVTALVR